MNLNNLAMNVMNEKNKFDNKVRQMGLDQYQYQRKLQAYLKEQEYYYFMAGGINPIVPDINPVIGSAKIGVSKIQ